MKFTMSAMSVKKQAIRIQTVQKISALSGTYRQQADISIHKAMLSLPEYAKSKIICYYVSTKYEVDTIDLIKKQLALKNKRIIVPKIDAQNLSLYEIYSWNDLHTGAYGIQEPSGTSKRISPRTVDLFLIPGIAFGKDKTRIGRGAAYYDRLLHGVRGTTIGLAYDAQIYLTLPHSKQDIQLDIIVTESHIYDVTVTPFRSKNLSVHRIRKKAPKRRIRTHPI